MNISLAVKSAFVSVFFVSIFLLNSAQALSPITDSQAETIGAYYGDSLGDMTQPVPVKDPALKGRLYEVLRLSHASKTGRADRLVPTCQNEPLEPGEACTERRALSYQGARQKMFGEFYLSQNPAGLYQVWDVYCQKNVTEQDVSGVGPGKIPDHTKINAEHTWPQSRFNANEERNTQKTDLHHLYPTDSKMNQVRSNFEFGEIDKAQGTEQRCTGNWLGLPIVPNGMRLPNAQSFFEVPDQHKGNVARSLMYFAVRYRANMTPVEEHYMRLWNRLDPVDVRDIALNQEIFKVQGNRNPFVDFPQLVDAIPDFASAEYRPVNGSGEGDTVPKPSNPAQNPGQQGQATSPHRLQNGVFQVLGSDGNAIVTLQGVVAACAHTNYGVRGAPFSTYELFALDQSGTLHKIRGGSGSRRDVKTEAVTPAGQTLEQAMATKGLACAPIVSSVNSAQSPWANVITGSSSAAPSTR